MLLFSRSVMSNSLPPPWTAACQAPLSFTISRSLFKFMWLSWWCYLTISSSTTHSPHSFILSQHQGLFQCGGSSHQVAKILELQLQHQSFQWIFQIDFLEDWLVCNPRDSQKLSPAPQFKKINSLVLSLLCGPTLTSTHGYWKNHSFDYMDLCRQSDVAAF